MAKIFIGYSRKDKAFVQKLHEALTREKMDVWVDWEDIPPTAKWLREIYKGIETADNYIFVISPDSAASEICGMEIEHGEKHNKRFIPVLYRDPGNIKLRDSISSHHWVMFNDETKFEESLVQLRQAIETDLEHVEMHTKLLLQAKEWLKGQRNDSYLLEGEQLAAAEKWLANAETKKPEPLRLHRVFIRESVKSRQRDDEEKRKRRIYMGLRDETLRVYIRPFLLERKKELEKQIERMKSQSQTALTAEIVEAEEELNGLMNFLSAGGKWHLQEPIVIKKLGPKEDYLNIFEFPCCGAQVLADKSPSRFRRDGCQDSPLTEDMDDEPAPPRTMLKFDARPILKKLKEQSGG